ncbi:DNA topoisomerase 2 [Hordeum vulgare]|nr:DNA topoisomerase 2 [Hordeum vulgare]
MASSIEATTLSETAAENSNAATTDVVLQQATKVMACPFYRAAGGPCSSFDSCASVFTVVLDRSCSRRVYIPCSVRSHLVRYIEECRALAIRRGDTDVDLALHNTLEDLSETQRELVDNCFYSRGVTLNYHQMYVMSRQLFDDDYILCFPFVHRITSLNVNDQHMVIPSLVVSSLKDFLSILRTGSLTLEIGLDSEDDDIYVSIPCSYFIGLSGRMVFKKGGFSNFLRASSIEVNNLVLITFKERDQELAVIFNLLPQ